MGAVPGRILVRAKWPPPDVLGVSGFPCKRPMMVPPTLNMSCPMDRISLRRNARALRRSVAADVAADVEWPSELWSALSNRRCVAGYWPLRCEISPIALLTALVQRDIAVCFPCFVDRRAQMEFRRWTPDIGLDPSPFDFAQPPLSSPPMVPDCLLVPTLAFDRRGNRIGQGGGHYDRYLARHPEHLRIGVAWWQQERTDIVPEPWDMPLHAIATDREWIDCATIEGQTA